MTSTWDELANGPRWHGVVSFIRQWIGPFDSHQGMEPEELGEILRARPLNLPEAVREWYLLAAKWDQGGLNVWIHPWELTACDGLVCVLTDTERINQWGVRVADLDTEDPPIYSQEASLEEIEFPAFSAFVAAMIANDVIFCETEAPVELDPGSARADLTCLVSARCGDYYADAALESATVVMFAYPGNGPVYGKARTPAGRARLQRLRRQTA